MRYAGSETDRNGTLWHIYDAREGISVPDRQGLLDYCLDERAADPTQRLCAYDEWKDILLSWMRECTGDDVDRYLRLHTILQRCIHS